jgi:4-hydroxy-3-methylbut-2-en-1-yl diphosphate reductase
LIARAAAPKWLFPPFIHSPKHWPLFEPCFKQPTKCVSVAIDRATLAAKSILPFREHIHPILLGDESWGKAFWHRNVLRVDTTASLLQTEPKAMAVEKVVLAKPRGFCAGVEMAIETLERALQRHGAPIYVFHEIVHNRYVVQEFSRRGVQFVHSVEEVPAGAKLVLSAHGVSPVVWQQTREKGLEAIIDATCPLVDKVHREVRKFAAQGFWIILVGHAKHDEIVGTSGEAPERVCIVENVDQARTVSILDPDKVVALTQTTLSVDDTREVLDVLKRRFPRIHLPAKEDICYATQNRQDAVKQLARAVDLVFVIGSRNSENSNQLCDVARSQGTPAHLIDDYHMIEHTWLEGIRRVGITSGASVPERLVQEAAEYFRRQGAEVGQLGFIEENIHFTLPSEIRS